MTRKPGGAAIALLVTAGFVVLAFVFQSLAGEPDDPECDTTSLTYCAEP